MDSNQLFEQTKPIKLFFMAAVPGTLGMLAGSLYGLYMVFWKGFLWDRS